MRKLLSITLLALAMVSFSKIAVASCGDPCCPPTPKPVCEPCKECEICPPCEPCKPCCTDTVKIGEPCKCAYNAPARIDPACGWDAWVTASFLYWQPKEKGLEIGYHFNNSGTTGSSVTTNNPIDFDFDFDPAFKLGLGFSSDRDDWTLYFEYTRFYSTDKSHLDLTGSVSANNYILSPWICYDLLNDATAIIGGNVVTDKFSYASGSWKLKMNIVDADLGRPFYLGKKIIFKPYIGLRGGSIDQKLGLTYTYVNPANGNSLNLYSSNKLDAWLVGPRVGVDTDWLIACKVRIFGNVSGSLCYEKFKSKINIDMPAQTNVTAAQVENYKAKDSIGLLSPNFELDLGLGWGSYFCNNEWYFDLTVGYSFNYFWDQNMFRHLADQISLLADNDASDLMLQGLTITARLDF